MKNCFQLHLGNLLITVMAQSENQFPGKDSLTTIPLIKISNEPRFLSQIHTAYSMRLGSMFKFYPSEHWGQITCRKEQLM